MRRGAEEPQRRSPGFLRRFGSPILRLLAFAALAAGCAQPVAPSGGPQDTTPPALEAAEPAADAVNVRAGRLVLTFSEGVDEASVRRAFSISPGWETPPEVIVRGRRVEVRFPDSLRANTTYVVTLDTNLRDLRSVALRAPLTLAFATGPELDRGRIAGRVLDPMTGRGTTGLDVFAYRLDADASAPPDPTSEAPDYRTQTDAQGAFSLDYLRPGPFFLAAVADANRNRRADAGEAFAVPPAPATTAAEADSARGPLRLFETRLDTIPPRPIRVRTQSARRLAVRFDEPIVLRDRLDLWTLTDSTSGADTPVLRTYPDTDPQQLVLVTDSLPARPHRLVLGRPAAVTDSVGNAARPDPLTFTPSAEPDTVRARFLGFLPESPEERVRADSAGVRFNAPPDSAWLARVAVTDTLGNALPSPLTTRDGLRFWVEPEGFAPYRLAVRTPDSTYARTVEPLTADERGEIAGVVRAEGGPVIVEVVAGRARHRVRADSTGAFVVTGLSEGEVRLRAWIDRNENGRWDGGRLAPYAPPEPLVFLDAPQRIRPRWETVVDTLVIE